MSRVEQYRSRGAQDLRPVMLCGLTWKQAKSALGAVDCAARRPHWCSPVVILGDAGLPVLDDDGDISPLRHMRGDLSAKDWMLVPRVDDDGNKIEPSYRRNTQR